LHSEGVISDERCSTQRGQAQGTVPTRTLHCPKLSLWRQTGISIGQAIRPHILWGSVGKMCRRRAGLVAPLAGAGLTAEQGVGLIPTGVGRKQSRWMVLHPTADRGEPLSLRVQDCSIGGSNLDRWCSTGRRGQGPD